MELHVTSPAHVRDAAYCLTGVVRTDADASRLEGVSVRIRSLVTGLMDEAFLDDHGAFAQDLELQPETDNSLELTVCEGDGAEAGRVIVTIHCQSSGPASGQGVLPAQIVAKPMENRRNRALDPPCRPLPGAEALSDLAVEGAKATGRPAEELFEHVHAQQRYAEEAFEEQNQTLYQECRENLEKVRWLSGSTGLREIRCRGRVCRDFLRSGGERFRGRFRNDLATVWNRCQATARSGTTLGRDRWAAHGFTQRMKSNRWALSATPGGSSAEVRKIEGQLTEPTASDRRLLPGCLKERREYGTLG